MDSINKNLENLYEQQKKAMESIKTGECILNETFNSAFSKLTGQELKIVTSLKQGIDKVLAKAKKGQDIESDINQLKQQFNDSGHR